VYFVKEYLTPNIIQKHGLANILRAFVIPDPERPGADKSPLGGLYPNTHQSFDDAFPAREPGT
jgi:hypothetical protein